jgi:hypothetical protein
MARSSRGAGEPAGVESVFTPRKFQAKAIARIGGACGTTFASAASRPTATSTPRAPPRGDRGAARPAVGAADPRDAFGLPGSVAYRFAVSSADA